VHVSRLRRASTRSSRAARSPTSRRTAWPPRPAPTRTDPKTWIWKPRSSWRAAP